MARRRNWALDFGLGGAGTGGAVGSLGVGTGAKAEDFEVDDFEAFLRWDFVFRDCGGAGAAAGAGAATASSVGLDDGEDLIDAGNKKGAMAHIASARVPICRNCVVLLSHTVILPLGSQFGYLVLP